MAEIVVSSFSDRDEKEIDEYYNESNSIKGSSSESITESSSLDEIYSSGTPGIPLEVF